MDNLIVNSRVNKYKDIVVISSPLIPKLGCVKTTAIYSFKRMKQIRLTLKSTVKGHNTCRI